MKGGCLKEFQNKMSYFAVLLLMNTIQCVFAHSFDDFSETLECQ